MMIGLSKKIIKNHLYILFISTFLISVILFLLDLFSVVNKTSVISQNSSVLKYEFIVLFIFAVLITLIFIYVNKYILTPLSKIKTGVNAIKDGTISFRLDVKGNNEINQIAYAFNNMAINLEDSYKKLEQKSSELYDKNWELQEANIQLEASYSQLQAYIEQLNEAEEKYHALVRNIPEIVCVIDDKGTISFVNHLCLDVLGYEKSELIGRNISELFDTNSEPLSVSEISSKLDDKNSITLELIMKRNDGKSVITEAKFTNYVFNGMNMGLQAIIRDISQKRKMEEEIIQNNKELGILNSVSKSLTSTLDTENLLNLIVNEITYKLNLPACTFGLIDSENTHMQIKAYAGDYYKNIESSHILKSYNLNSSFLKKLINDVQIIKSEELPECFFTSEFNNVLPENKRLKEFLVFPVNINNQIKGILAVGSILPFTLNDANIISSITNNAAVALDNAMLYETVKKYFIKTIDALIAAVEAKDNYTEGHSQRVSIYAVQIAEKLQLDKEQIADIKIAGILHDIGKIGISDSILSKPDKLTSSEYELVKQHPLISNKILYPVGFSDRTLKAIAFHHERYDGKGYPYGLVGDAISIEAQVISVADAFDAMTSCRSYRGAMQNEDALKELVANKSTQFNPRIVDAFSEIINTI